MWLFWLLTSCLGLIVASENACNVHHMSLPSFEEAFMDKLPNDLPQRCNHCPLGLMLNESVAVTGGFSRGGDFTRWHHLFKRILHHDSKNMNLTIGVLGGSMAYGNFYTDLDEYRRYTGVGEPPCRRQCEIEAVNGSRTEYCSKCTFSNRFEYWLRHAYPKLNVRVINYALPATNSQSVLSLLGQEFFGETLDVVYVNYADNDRNFDERDPDVVSASFERLIRTLLSLPNRPVVVNIEIFSKDFGDLDGIYHGHRDVISYYDLPTLNYDAAAAPKFQLVDRHPPWPWHQMIADLMAYSWKTVADKMCGYQVRAPMPQFKHVRQVLSDFCLNPTTLIRADNPSTFKPADIKYQEGLWEYGEDVPGKFGWFIDSQSPFASISFTVNIDATRVKATNHAIIGLGYLKSYDGMGTIRVFLNDDRSRYVYINGSNEDPSHRTSMVYFKRLCVPTDHPTANDSPAEHLVPICNQDLEEEAKMSVNSHIKQSVTLNIELIALDSSQPSDPNRFKIVYLISC